MEKQKCLSKDYAGKDCVFRSINGTAFCKFHQYMVEYTPEMLANLERCNGCKKMYYFEDGHKTCDKCRERGTKNKAAKKETEVIVFCGKEGCKFKRSDENPYCGKHQICLFEDETRELNKKLCYNYIRGCREQLDQEYKFSKCEECLEKEREKDRKRRDHAKEKNNNFLENGIVTKKCCTTCIKELSIEEFELENNQYTKTCKSCRKDNNIQDKRRDKEHRNEIVRKSTRSQYTEYKKNAAIRKIEFFINYEEYVAIVKKECYYCGILQEKGINGIDRVDSKNGYVLNNCVSCCKICNYMKRAMDVGVFLGKIEHILCYQNKINGRVNPELFKDHMNVSYKNYMNSAKDRNIDFYINAEQFYEITKNNCYMCGKENSDSHKNGIDRFINNLGYTIENSRACCCECNLMKHVNSFQEILTKFLAIHERHNNK